MRWQKLVEIEDKDWFPQLFRDQITDVLRYLIIEMRIYDPIIPELLWTMQQSETKKVVDLCSGGTGPWEYLIQTIRHPEKYFESITLTDKYPNKRRLHKLSQSHPLFNYRADSIDARSIDRQLTGVRTLFSCFHHFDTVEATAILQDAVDKQMPICIFEFTERRLLKLLFPPVSMVWLFTSLLFKRRLTLPRLLFCYLVPIVPLTYLWDSTVSHLRSYSEAELQAILNKVDKADTFTWEIGKSTSPRSHLKNTFLIGYPNHPE